MDQLIEIAFKGNRKEFFLWEGDAPPPLRAAVIVDADRGEDLGRVHATGDLAEKRAAGVPHAPGAEGTQKRARRLATDEDVQRHEELRAQDESARRRAMERVKANNLVMKLSDAEWQWDRRKLTIYFTAEKRVDFRNLVRDLAALFRTRIELKQIGVRDEAKRLGGIGRCGREYCSASRLPELRPVNLGVAKDQRLSLNPAQISGACGRLMCCLRYEHEFYVQSRRRFPKEGKILVTSRGEEKVVANDIFNDRVTVRNVEGDVRVVPLAALKSELAAVERPGELPVLDVAEDETPTPGLAIAEDGFLGDAPRDEARGRLPGTPRGMRPRSPLEAVPRPMRDERPDVARVVEDNIVDPAKWTAEHSIARLSDPELATPNAGVPPAASTSPAAPPPTVSAPLAPPAPAVVPPADAPDVAGDE